MTALYQEEPVAAEVSPAGVMEMLALRLNGFGARLLLSPFPPQPPPYLWGGGLVEDCLIEFSPQHADLGVPIPTSHRKRWRQRQEAAYPRQHS